MYVAIEATFYGVGLGVLGQVLDIILILCVLSAKWDDTSHHNVDETLRLPMEYR